MRLAAQFPGVGVPLGGGRDGGLFRLLREVGLEDSTRLDLPGHSVRRGPPSAVGIKSPTGSSPTAVIRLVGPTWVLVFDHAWPSSHWLRRGLWLKSGDRAPMRLTSGCLGLKSFGAAQPCRADGSPWWWRLQSMLIVWLQGILAPTARL